MTGEVPELASLQELVKLYEDRPGLYVRWAPEWAPPRGGSVDELTGAALPGLSVNPLAPEPWWGQRPLELWLARRLYDYCHLRHVRPRPTRAWVLDGTVVGRGPDNEPLLAEPEPVARLSSLVLDEARALLRLWSHEDAEWGPLRRPPEISRG
ncbi:DUF6098 family protein [Amycolatopsis sp. NPDC059657]|uniref:DUF6098 family protein n=1 Tax=Amycolatopsis sp. NPDC059657 TaxID=3346899 RepID=UPI00367288A1